MDLTLTGGTPQQRRWVQDAISQCSYPLDTLPVTVTVRWLATLPDSSDLGHAHAYMVTDSDGAGNFTISINSAADDPSWSEVSGLPNPAQDVCTFYKQSFVHELGHVAHFTAITDDAARTQIAGLFWRSTTDGSLRRYGTLADWSSSTWQQNMMEAVAECVKCGFYKERLIYLNRTDWNIDEKDWPTLIAALQGASGGEGLRENFAGDMSAYAPFGSRFNNYATSAAVPLHSGASTPGLWIASSPHSATGYTDPTRPLDTSIASVKIAQVFLSDIIGESAGVYVGRGIGADTSECAHAIFSTTLSLGSSLHNVQLMPLDDGPSIALPGSYVENLYLVCRRTRARLVAELWDADPYSAAPSHKLLSVSGSAVAVTSEYPAIQGQADNGPGTWPPYPQALVLTDWRCAPLITTVPPFPFGPLPGSIAVTAGDRGQLVIGP